MSSYPPPYPPGYIPLSWFEENRDFSSRVIHDMAYYRKAYKAWTTPTEMTFGTIAVGNQSAAQTGTVRNIGYRPLRILSVKFTGDYLVTHNAPLVLDPGKEFQISVIFNPLRNGMITGGVYIDTGDAAGTEYISFLGYGTSSSGPGPGPGDLPTITISNGILEEYVDPGEPDGEVSVLPLLLAFGSVDVGAESDVMQAVITNDTDAAVTILSATVPTGFELVDMLAGVSIPAGGSLNVGVKFVPEEVDSFSGSLTVNFTGVSLSVSLTGTGAEVPVLFRLRTLGNQIVTVDDQTPVRLKTVNWHGAQGENYTPNGTWARPYKGIIDQIKGMGFNCIRMPFSGDFCTPGRAVPETAFDADLNPEFVGLNALQVMDLILDYCEEVGLYVVFDHHRRTQGAGAQGSPIDGSYTMTHWKASWTTLANRYGDRLCVIGADLHNEPHELTWNTWAGYAEEVGNHISSMVPEWLIFVEGVGNIDDDNYWWGGQLKGVGTRPVVLNQANRLVYSPHEYGQSVGTQTWLRYDSNPSLPVGYPNNLYAIWTAYWGFIFENNIAPIWIGEFGGFFGVDGNGNVTKPHGTYETQWATNLVKYLNGDYDGNGVSNLPVGKLGMSFAYWCYNPNSGDTGGLIRDDWSTPQTVKLNIIAPLLS